MKKLVVKNAPSESNLLSACSVKIPRWYLLAILLMVLYVSSTKVGHPGVFFVLLLRGMCLFHR